MHYTPTINFFLTAFGVVLALVLYFTLNSEISYLAQNKKHRLQFVLSMISLGVMFLVMLTALLHWFVRADFAYTVIMLALPILLILAASILWLRAKAFRSLARERMEEQRKLIREIVDLIDEKKKEKIKEGKQARGDQ